MTLENMLPEYEVHRQPIEDCPEQWSSLLSVGAFEAGSQLCDHIGLKPHSKVRKLITTAADVALLIPQRKRERKKIRNWRLALRYSEDSAMLFWPPSDWDLTGNYPDEYIQTVNEVGPFQFTQHSGHLMSPKDIESESLELNDTMRLESDGAGHLTPFFDHETGDFDCWLGEDQTGVYCYDHETRQVALYATGFTAWFEKRFMHYAEV